MLVLTSTWFARHLFPVTTGLRSGWRNLTYQVTYTHLFLVTTIRLHSGGGYDWMSINKFDGLFPVTTTGLRSGRAAAHEHQRAIITSSRSRRRGYVAACGGRLS